MQLDLDFGFWFYAHMQNGIMNRTQLARASATTEAVGLKLNSFFRKAERQEGERVISNWELVGGGTAGLPEADHNTQ